MKNTNTCPKCGGTDILHIKGDEGTYYDNVIPMGLFSSNISISRCLCCRCGYSEEWIDPQDIPKLKKKYGQA